MRTSVKDAKRRFTDDTSWRINGKSASMMGFDTDEATVYKSVYVIAARKCGYYIIRSIDKVLEDKAGSVCTFGETLKTLLKDAIALWQRYHAGGVDDFFPCIT